MKKCLGASLKYANSSETTLAKSTNENAEKSGDELVIDIEYEISNYGDITNGFIMSLLRLMQSSKPMSSRSLLLLNIVFRVSWVQFCSFIADLNVSRFTLGNTSNNSFLVEKIVHTFN